MPTRFDKTIGPPPPSFRGDEDDPQIRQAIAESIISNVQDNEIRAVKEKHHTARNNTMVADMLSKLRKQDTGTAPMEEPEIEDDDRFNNPNHKPTSTPPKRSIFLSRSRRQIAPAPPTNIDAITIHDVPIKRSRSLFGRLFGQSSRKVGGNVRKQRKSRKQIKSRKMRKQRKQRKSKRVSY